ncbi:hypothetical protein ISS37_00935 [candidate division KSB1 bacterium]|nr:hypothetical protein [candidate division KSB1 bacterium]
MTRGYAQELVVLGDTIFVAEDQGGVEIFNVSNPYHPTLDTSFFTIDTSDVSGITGSHLNQTLIVVTENQAQFYSYLDSIYSVGNAYDRDIEDIKIVEEKMDTVVVAASDLSDGFGIHWFAYYEQFGVLNWWQIKGNFIRLDWNTRGFFVKFPYAYVAMEQNGLAVIDESDIDSPVLLSSVDTPGSARDVWVDSTFAFIACGRAGLQVVDISNLDSLVLVGGYDTNEYNFYADRIVVKDKKAFLACRRGGMKVCDILDPRNPILVGFLNTPYANDVFVDEEYIYLADRDQGLLIIAWDN